jgi:rhodanese-related sulfurtransferase
MQRYPQARLVDVRDAAEHAAGLHWLPAAFPVDAAPLNLPLDVLRHSLPAAITQAQGQGPWVLFCRSGARSREAAALLRARGHGLVWHLEGGLALAEMA